MASHSTLHAVPPAASRHTPSSGSAAEDVSELDKAAESAALFLIEMANATDDTRTSCLMVSVRGGPGTPVCFDLSYYRATQLAGRIELALPAICSSRLKRVVQDGTRFLSNLANSLRIGEVVISGDLAAATAVRIRPPVLY